MSNMSQSTMKTTGNIEIYTTVIYQLTN